MLYPRVIFKGLWIIPGSHHTLLLPYEVFLIFPISLQLGTLILIMTWLLTLKEDNFLSNTWLLLSIYRLRTSPCPSRATVITLSFLPQLIDTFGKKRQFIFFLWIMFIIFIFFSLKSFSIVRLSHGIQNHKFDFFFRAHPLQDLSHDFTKN